MGINCIEKTYAIIYNSLRLTKPKYEKYDAMPNTE